MSALARPALLNSPDRRRFQRASLALSGRILDSRGMEHDCRTADLSPGGARIYAASKPQLGESVVIYLNEIGRLPAAVARVEPEAGFGVVFEASAHKREKIAEQMTWMLNKHRFAEGVERRAERFVPAAAISVTLEDGTPLVCDVMDVSLVGASLRTRQQRPQIGAWVRVGQTDGRVSRYHEGGFAVDFQPRMRF